MLIEAVNRCTPIFLRVLRIDCLPILWTRRVTHLLIAVLRSFLLDDAFTCLGYLVIYISTLFTLSVEQFLPLDQLSFTVLLVVLNTNARVWINWSGSAIFRNMLAKCVYRTLRFFACHTGARSCSLTTQLLLNGAWLRSTVHIRAGNMLRMLNDLEVIVAARGLLLICIWIGSQVSVAFWAILWLSHIGSVAVLLIKDVRLNDLVGRRGLRHLLLQLTLNLASRRGNLIRKIAGVNGTIDDRYRLSWHIIWVQSGALDHLFESYSLVRLGSWSVLLIDVRFGSGVTRRRWRSLSWRGQNLLRLSLLMMELILYICAAVAIVWKDLHDGGLAECLLARQYIITLILLLQLFQALIATLLALLHSAGDACGQLRG